MTTIDGAAKFGSGTIVRYSVALASPLGKEMKIPSIVVMVLRHGIKWRQRQKVETEFGIR